MAPAGRYIPSPTDHEVSKGNPSCQSLISPWSKFLFYKTFTSTLAYDILCALGFPLFFLYFLIFLYFSILISLNLELVPPCRIAIRNVTSLAIGLLCWCTSGAFLRVDTIGSRLRPIWCWYLAIEKLRRYSAAIVDRSVRGCCHDISDEDLISYIR